MIRGSATQWAKETITVSQAGEYRFVFVSGTYDLTGGRAAGAQLFIDNVEADAEPLLLVDDSHLSAIAQRVQYANTSDESGISKTLTVSVQDADENGVSESAVLTIIPVNDVPPIYDRRGPNSCRRCGHPNYRRLGYEYLCRCRQ